MAGIIVVSSDSPQKGTTELQRSRSVWTVHAQHKTDSGHTKESRQCISARASQVSFAGPRLAIMLMPIAVLMAIIAIIIMRWMRLVSAGHTNGRW